MNRLCSKVLFSLFLGLLFETLCHSASAAQLVLKDGRILDGRYFPITGVIEVPQSADAVAVTPIYGIDDDLRRTFIPRRLVQQYLKGTSVVFERYRIRQRVARSGMAIKTVGVFIPPVEDFTEYGRRTVWMNLGRGPVPIIQCITEITPHWTKVQSHSPYVWDMRIATSSIPPNVLAKILAKLTKPDDLEAREKLARFYLQAERYEQAFKELESLLADFPDDEELRKRLEPPMRALRQQGAQRSLAELRLRREAGQHRLVYQMLKKFPSEGVAGNILEDVRQMKNEYESQEAEYKQVLAQFDTLLGQIKDEGTRQRIEPIAKEIHAELNINTLARLGGFQLMLDDDSLPAEEKLALAVSGWLLGRDAATEKLPVALSVFEVRDLVLQYLNAKDALSRAEILKQFYAQEGGTPQMVAHLLAHMKPPLGVPSSSLAGEAPAEESPGETPQVAAKPGFFELEVIGLPNAPPVRYVVQLPPEYDPYRRYPAILTLPGAGRTPELQVDWWAGAWTQGGWRNGQATRHGYIVIAPAWAEPHQMTYQYSFQEHTAVLSCLRDACRRFAIDTDRVFLSGHSMGGDAAWDIGLAHPDLWAGVIPIVARSDKYCARYWENARQVPFYFVCGQLDADRMFQNARDFDRYLIYAGFNCTVVEYIGRGHDHFSDEIQRLFDWMDRFRREFYPKEFKTWTMRPWDNFFWWIELDGLPPGSMVDPIDWPRKGARPMETEASITATNGLNVRTGATYVCVWLSPHMLDFDRRIEVVVNRRR
ncbi:MAG: tetratricopeptide repeat protein, partial [Planctomycetota bacterium]